MKNYLVDNNSNSMVSEIERKNMFLSMITKIIINNILFMNYE